MRRDRLLERCHNVVLLHRLRKEGRDGEGPPGDPKDGHPAEESGEDVRAERRAGDDELEVGAALHYLAEESEEHVGVVVVRGGGGDEGGGPNRPLTGSTNRRVGGRRGEGRVEDGGRSSDWVRRKETLTSTENRYTHGRRHRGLLPPH